MSRVFIGRLLGVLLLSGLCVAQGCSSDPERSPSVGGAGNGGNGQGGSKSASGGRAGGASATGGKTATGGASGADPGGAGEPGDAGATSGGSSGSSSGGAADVGGEGGVGGVPPDPYRCPSDESAEPSPSLVSDCDPAMVWGQGELVSVERGDGDQLIGVTPDELTIVWFDARGSAGTYRLADRASSDAAFEPSQALSVGDVLALSPDGLRLVSFSPDQSALVESVRPARGEAFGAGEDGAFSLLNADALTKGYRVLDALIAPNDEKLYYNIHTGEALEYSLHVSTRSGAEPWPIGVPIEACELKAFGSLVRHPTGVSADGLTLFFFDPARNTARAGFRRSPGGPFVWFTDLGARYQATPNQSCDKLYYFASDVASSLFVSAAE